MREKAKVAVLVVLLSALALAGMLVPIGADTEYQDYGSGGSGGGGCTYCSQGQCGCAPPPAGQTLSFSCSCSSIWCTRSCNYY